MQKQEKKQKLKIKIKTTNIMKIILANKCQIILSKIVQHMQVVIKRRPSYKQCSEPSKKYIGEMKSKFDVEYEIHMMQKKDQNIGDWI